MVKGKNARVFAAVLVIFAMMVLMIPTVSANTVAIGTPSVDYDDDGEAVLTVDGTLSATSGDITILAVRGTVNNLTSIPNDLTADDIVYVDQIPVVPAGDSGKMSRSFKLRDTGSGSYITVFMGGTDVETYVCKTVQVLSNPGTVELAETDKDYYINGDVVLDLTNANEDWLNAVTINVYDGDELAGSVNKTTGAITIDAVQDEATTYTIKFEGAADFNAVEDIELSVISADGAKLAEIVGEPTINKSDANEWTITMPDAPEGVIFTATVNGENAAITNGNLVVARNDVGGAAKAVVVTATAGTATKTWPFEVLAQGAEPSISADDIELIGENVFSKYKGNGYKIVIITTDTVDYTKQSIKIGKDDDAVVLFYNNDNHYFIGLIKGYDNADAVADAADIIDQASTVMYYGKASVGEYKPTTNTKVLAVDYAYVRKIVLNKKAVLDELTDVQMIAADVASGTHDGKILAADYAAIRKLILKKISNLPIIKAAAE